MLISFEQYVESESRRLERFKSWYIELNKQDPEQFPLMLNDDKLEYWDETFNGFEGALIKMGLRDI